MSKKILIIDDEGSDRKAMSLALNKAGYSEIMVADSADSGIQMAEAFSPDVILIDVVLHQEVDGFDVCVKIKEAESIKAKIIMVTGHLDAINVEKARKSGADEILEKRVTFDNLAETIARLN